MKNMFKGATVFKQNLNDWKLGAATTTAGMFEGAAAFNAPVNAWDVSKVADISKMFSAAAAFNQDLSAWDVGAVPGAGAAGGGNKADEAFYKTGMSNCNKKTIYDKFKAIPDNGAGGTGLATADYQEIADKTGATDGEDWNAAAPSC